MRLNFSVAAKLQHSFKKLMLIFATFLDDLGTLFLFLFSVTITVINYIRYCTGIILWGGNKMREESMGHFNLAWHHINLYCWPRHYTYYLLHCIWQLIAIMSVRAQLVKLLWSPSQLTCQCVMEHHSCDIRSPVH